MVMNKRFSQLYKEVFIKIYACDQQKRLQALKEKDIQLFPLDPRKDFEKLNGHPRFDAIWEKVDLPPLKN